MKLLLIKILLTAKMSATLNMLGTTCAAQSVDGFQSIVTTLLQFLTMAQCDISSPQKWPEDYGNIALEKGLEEYDFVVIGAGTAGSVVASRLSENPEWKVLLLEAGGNPPQESEVPALSFLLQHTNYTWNYFTEPSQRTNKAMKNDRCYWPRGKFLGGCGGINSMFSVRGNRKDFDTWANAGNEGWSWNEVYPYFEKSVRPHGNETHPDGYLTTGEFPQLNGHIRNMIFNGAKELGIPIVERFEEGSYIGYSSLPGTIQNAERQSTAKGYLARIGNRPNLHIIKHAEVTKINFDKSGKRVKSVAFTLRENHKLKVKISKELVLSAGAINSPKLLMLSGIGPKEHLDSLGIPVLHDLHVGDNLQDHLNGLVMFKINENKAKPISTIEIIENTFDYLIHRSAGFLANDNLGTWTAFLNTLPNSVSPYPDIVIHHFFIRRGSDLSSLSKGLVLKPEYEQQISDLVITSDFLLASFALLQPKSIGKLRLSSKNPQDPPIIDANYFNDPSDEDTVLRAIKHLRKMENTESFKNLNARVARISIPECDSYDFESETFWRCYLKYFTSTIYHHVGTVKMGPKNDSTACVDPKLRLHGVKNLRVVDASIMPFITSGNTNTPTVMIAEKAADYIRESWNKNAGLCYKNGICYK